MWRSLRTRRHQVAPHYRCIIETVVKYLIITSWEGGVRPVKISNYGTRWPPCDLPRAALVAPHAASLLSQYVEAPELTREAPPRDRPELPGRRAVVDGTRHASAA